jgi:hypothetical protein
LNASRIQNPKSITRFCLPPSTIQNSKSNIQNLLHHPTMMRFLYIILCTVTAMIGYTIHGSLFWSIVNFIFCPISWAKWLICKEVSLSVIKQTFAFLFT